MTELVGLLMKVVLLSLMWTSVFGSFEGERMSRILAEAELPPNFVHQPDQNDEVISKPSATEDVDASYVDRDFAYKFKMFYGEGETLNSALQAVSDSVMMSLDEVLRERDAPVSLQFLSSTETGSCNDIDFDLEGYECANAETKVTVKADPELDPELMERVALVEIQKFIPNFNDQNASININFDYPVSVRSTVVLIFEGVVGTMGPVEQNVFLSSFEDGFSPLAQNNENPSFEFDKAEVVIQDSGYAQRLRRVLEEGTFKGTSYNKAQIFIRATCGTANCTNENFDSFTVGQMTEWSAVLAVMLRNNGEKAGTLYFDNLHGITVGESLIVELPPDKDIVLNNDSPKHEDAPSWIWIPVGIVVGIFACTLCWVTFRINKRDEKESALRKEAIAEKKQRSVRSKEKSQKLVAIEEVPSDAGAPWPANDPDISSSNVTNSNHVKHSVYSEDTRPISNVKVVANK